MSFEIGKRNFSQSYERDYEMTQILTEIRIDSWMIDETFGDIIDSNDNKIPKQNTLSPKNPQNGLSPHRLLLKK